MTGIHDSIFSQSSGSINNLERYTLNSPQLSEHFGLSESEFLPIIEDIAKRNGTFNSNEILDRIREWYNGYSHSKSGEFVYNAWSIMVYLENLYWNNEKEPKGYWRRTGTTQLLNCINTLSLSEKSIENYVNLSKGWRFSGEYKETFSLIDYINQFYQVDHAYYLNSLLVHQGYLIKDSRGRLTTPNKEVQEDFKENIFSLIKRSNGEYINFLKNFATNIDDLDKLQPHLEELIEKYPPTDYLSEEHLNSITFAPIEYYNIFTGSNTTYLLRIENVLSGNRKIVLPNKNYQGSAIIHECKIAERHKDVEKKAIEAFNQICYRGYVDRILKESNTGEISSVKLRPVVFYQDLIDGKWNLQINEYSIDKDEISEFKTYVNEQFKGRTFDEVKKLGEMVQIGQASTNRVIEIPAKRQQGESYEGRKKRKVHD